MNSESQGTAYAALKYLGVILGNRIIWTLHTEMTEAKAFRELTGIYSILKGEPFKGSGN
jgi:hypothetical protein